MWTIHMTSITHCYVMVASLKWLWLWKWGGGGDRIFPAHGRTCEELLIVWIQLQSQPVTLHDLFQHLTPLQSVLTSLPSFLIYEVCQQEFHWCGGGSFGSYLLPQRQLQKKTQIKKMIPKISNIFSHQELLDLNYWFIKFPIPTRGQIFQGVHLFLWVTW